MELILALLINNLSPKAVPAKKLAPEILRVANKYNVDPVLVTRIIIVESRGVEKAYNSRTRDFGLMQINSSTILSMGITEECVLNWRCNLEMGVKILSQFKRVCRYNVGTASLRGKRLEKCLHYESKLAMIE